MPRDRLAQYLEAQHPVHLLIRDPNEPRCVVQYAEWREDSSPDEGVLRAVLSALRDVRGRIWLCGAVLWLAPLVAVEYPICVLLWMFCFAHLTILIARSRTDRDARLYAQLAPQGDGEGSGQAPVEVRLYEGRTRIATDFGFSTIVDGSMCFTGLKTEFSFSTLSARRIPVRRSGVGMQFTRDGHTYMVRVRTLEGRFRGDPFGDVRELTAPENLGQTVIEVLPPTTPSRACVRDEIVRWVRRCVVPVAFLISPVALVLSLPFHVSPNPYAFALLFMSALVLTSSLYLGLKVHRLRALHRTRTQGSPGTS